MILDTSYLGDLIGRDDDALALSADLDARPDPVRLPTAVVWELFYGLGKMDNPSGLRRRYEAVIEGTARVDLDDAVARRAGTLRGKHASGETLSELDGADSIVAAHGLARDEPVVAADRDFADVDGLDVISY